MFARFEAFRLPQARVLWLNVAWFLSHGKDVTNASCRTRVENWLLNEFAYYVPGPNLESVRGLERKTFWADRYGSTGFGMHGGSGRVGTTGRFQVKGIGPTPLVGLGADWLHSHGQLWLEEAIRETLLSLIIGAESPCGAVPSLAIIDTGLNVSYADGIVGERCALLVRPFEYRLAHFERAPWFRRPKEEGLNPQLADVERVRQMCLEWSGGLSKSFSATPDLNQTFHNIGRQAAYAHMHRITHGGFFSSNFGLNGEFLDCGAAGSLEGWGRHINTGSGARFGDEIHNAALIAGSVSYYLNKFGGLRLQSTVLVDAFKQGYDEQWEREAKLVYGLAPGEPGYVTDIAQGLRRLFKEAQLNKASSNLPLTSLARACFDQVLENRKSPRERAHAHALADYHFSRRTHMERESLQKLIFETCTYDDGKRPRDPASTAQLMNTILSSCRKSWRGLPTSALIRTAQADDASSLIVFVNGDGVIQTWLQGPYAGGRVLLLGSWYRDTELSITGEIIEGLWSATVDGALNLEDDRLGQAVG